MVLTPNQVPAKDSEAAALLHQMFELTASLEAATGGSGVSGGGGGGGGGRLLGEADLAVLREKAVRASGDGAACADLGAERVANQLCGRAVGIATQISQLDFFRGAFMLVIEDLRQAQAAAV